MKKIALLSLAVALAALPALAVEVHLRDGTVVEASAYAVTGSYVMLTLADGHQVAYDVADVDLASLRQPGEEPAAGQPGAEEAPPSLSQGRQLALPADRPPASGIAITDADVKHVRDQAPADAEGETKEQTAPADSSAGYSVNGRVVLNGINVTSQGDDRWLVEGEVINHGSQPVINVKVQLQTVPARGQSPWSGEVAVAAQLMPGEKGVFSETFSAPAPPGKTQPDVRASVIWMQRGNGAGDAPGAGDQPAGTTQQGRRYE